MTKVHNKIANYIHLARRMTTLSVTLEWLNRPLHLHRRARRGQSTVLFCISLPGFLSVSCHVFADFVLDAILGLLVYPVEICNYGGIALVIKLVINMAQ